MPAFIEARELRKTYRVGKVDVPALRGISFSVQKGEFVTVVGPSGSGKSTLFYLLGGLTRADSGSVTIDGVDFATLSDGERTRLRKSKIGFVFQKLIFSHAQRALEHRDRGRHRRSGHARPRIPEKDHRDAWHFRKAGASAERAFRRRAAKSRAGPGSHQSPRHRAGGRTHGQPGFEKLQHRSQHAEPVEQGAGADGNDDYP